MNIAFTSTWQKTDFFAAVAKQLDPTVGVFWIVTSETYRRKLLEQGFPECTILHLRKDVALARDPQADLSLLSELERRTGESVKSRVLMDRFVSAWAPERAMRYAAYAGASIARFLDEHDIQVVIGEPAPLHDLLADLVCRATGRRYLTPFGVRLPVNRFQIYEGIFERDMVVTEAPTPAHIRAESLRVADEVIAAVTRERKRPAYWYKNNRVPRVGLRYLKRLAGGVYRATVLSRTDANSYSLGSVLGKLRYHMGPFNYLATRVRWNRIFEQPRPGERFVLFTLQKQPEYTVDVLGAPYSNQLEVIRNLARELPLDVALYVKEHRNCLGDRSARELASIKALPGVRLIDPYADVHELIRASEAVVSISGTVSLEAALYGKRSMVMADSFMTGFSTCERLERPWEVGRRLAGAAPAHDPEADRRYLAWLLENSFEGLISEPVTNPECALPDNAQKVARAIERAIGLEPAEPRELVASAAS